ncbi:MAG: hypothetical protein KatS3mg108_2791 [Isosphaeraceae bacterium]|nr:MAG: hypothetical protein KatS3mg108_2791 [Isosphaeraceae bacterium]
MPPSQIVIRGAREHNLRDVDLDLPRGQLICFTGVSGSGKSSLAFDTLYAEGQRRYMESLSSYARQFLGQLPKPQVDRIDGLSPSIAIQQKTAGRNPRSTVGTITEISDHLRVLFARVGTQHCPQCGQPVAAQTRDQIVARILDLPPRTPLILLAPLIRGQKGEYKDLFAELARAGFVRARVDGQIVSLANPPTLDRQIKHSIELVIDRLHADPASSLRLAEAVDTALKRGDGTLIVAVPGSPDLVLSSRYACPNCRIGFDPPSPQHFSFNSPQGMCPACDGLGTRHEFDPDLLVPDPCLSLWDGAIAPLGPVKHMGRWRRHLFEGLARTLEADSPNGPPPKTLLKTPWADLQPAWRDAILHGTNGRPIIARWTSGRRSHSHAQPWHGIATELLEKYRSGGWMARATLEPYLRARPCSECRGSRLNPRARAMRVAGRSLPELGSWPLDQLAAWFDSLAASPLHPSSPNNSHPLDPLSRTIADDLLKEIRSRLSFLLDVGLHYLSLDRPAASLSGGEAQRIRLASQVGARLVGVLYILDEPSIGLHPRDNDRLIASLQRLRDLGNTVIVVEHDEDTMRAADLLVDFGPGPGIHGGQIVAAGSLASIAQSKNSLTGQYLSGRKSIPIPPQRRSPSSRQLIVRGASHHNLKNLDVAFPLGLFICVTGVSGSGKSSLVSDILRNALARDLNGASTTPGTHSHIEGLEHLDKIIDIDQSPIGRTPRSNPATYIKLLDLIRDLYARLPDAKARGFKPGRFSFNVPGGRCEACEGNGSNRLEMDFLADVWVTCPVCSGKRFNRETLQVQFKGKSIADVLDMDVQEALDHFAHIPAIASMLQTLHRVGLDYIKLGQPSPTLSGGEAQRIKLARELVRKSTGRTLYVLDEPTTGLHFEDVRRLLDVLHGFVQLGNTVIVIEHNLDVIKTADWIIDLGPDGGDAGGRIVAQGTPEHIAAHPESHTGRALARLFDQPSQSQAVAPTPKSRASRPPRKRHRPRATDSPIQIRGAAQHNLKQLNLDLPRHRLTVFTGPSGSGKSSLAIDTLYAEGQRRYVESLSAYARQFLAPLQKPKVDHIHGLAPAICIEQKTTSKSPRSTVGTITEIHDYLRILFARLGQPHCSTCQAPIGTQTADEIVEKILHRFPDSHTLILAPVQPPDGDSLDPLWQELRTAGFARVRIDGSTHNLDTPPTLSRRHKHQIEVVVDRLRIRPDTRSRLADSVATALNLGRGSLRLALVDLTRPEPLWTVHRYSQLRACEPCGRSFEELTPQHFSFNSPLGWCPACQGLGVQQGADPAALIPDGRRSIRQGAIDPWPRFDDNPLFARMIETLAHHLGLDLDLPFDDLDAHLRRHLLHGTGDTWFHVPPAAGQPAFSFQYKGLFPAIDEAARLSPSLRSRLQGMVGEVECVACMGSRLRDDAAAVRFQGHTIDQIARWPLHRTRSFFEHLPLTPEQTHIAADLLREIRQRLDFLIDVGLDYLSLARPSPTLSGGEAQRIRLASQLGSGLTGVLYVLDEPTIGLHPRDNQRLLAALQRLRDLGNTLVVVEHDREIIQAADHLVDFGPGSGSLGGHITAAGTPNQIKSNHASLTGRYLTHRAAIPVPTNRRISPDTLPAPTPTTPATPTPGLRTTRKPHSSTPPPPPTSSRHHHPRRPPPQPQKHPRHHPPRNPHRRHRRLWLRQKLPGRRHPRPRGPPAHPPRLNPTRRPRPYRRPRTHRQSHHRRSIPTRLHTRLQPRHRHRPLRPHPPALRQTPRSPPPRLHPGPLLLQHPRRTLRSLPGPRPETHRNALPPRRLDHLRRLPRRSFRRRCPRRPVPWPLHRRRPGHDRRRRPRPLRRSPQNPQNPPDLARRRPRLPSSRTGRPYPLRRRIPTPQNRRRTGPPRLRTHPLPPRRTHHRPPPRRHPQTPGRPPPPRRPRQHRRRRRTQPRPDQIRRLGHRPRSRSRLRRRPPRRPGHSRADRCLRRQPHRTLPPAVADTRPA